jgi:hypothetical protein
VVHLTSVIDVVHDDGVDQEAGFALLAPVCRPHSEQLRIVFEGGHAINDFGLGAAQPVSELFEAGLLHLAAAIPGGPPGEPTVAEGVVGVHSLDRGAVGDEVPNCAAARGGQQIELVDDDGGEVGEERVFGFALEGFVKLPDQKFQDAAAHSGVDPFA